MNKELRYGEKCFRPGAIWLDDHGEAINAHGGGILRHGEIYYWFGEHKIAGKDGNRAHVGVHVYSSVDLYSWKDEGIALRVSNDPSSDITAGCIIERPKVVYNAATRRFVMWFHLELVNEDYQCARAAVAVADNPVGPYTYLHSMRPNRQHWPVNVRPDQANRQSVIEAANADVPFGENPITPTLNLLGRDFEHGQDSRDMTIFQDDDGRAYHVYASEMNSTIHIALLDEDYLHHSGTFCRVFENRWMEAPVVFKKAGRYYFIASGCTGWQPNAARSAMNTTIFGDWQELGNPAGGASAAITFDSQPTFILPVPGHKDAFIFMGDRWNPDNAIDGRYIWLPVTFKEGRPQICWLDEWDLSSFRRQTETKNHPG
jgi:Glycosyl hydrolases family 43